MHIKKKYTQSKIAPVSVIGWLKMGATVLDLLKVNIKHKNIKK